MTTAQRNILISLFMGSPVRDYHNDWNLLMPVVEKIEGLEMRDDNAVIVNISDAACEIKTIEDNHDDYQQENDYETKIEAVFIGVSDFIEWWVNEYLPDAIKNN